MSIVKLHDKRIGITYVYDQKSYWDKDRKQSRSKRTLIGKVDPESGEIIPTNGWGKNRGNKKTSGTKDYKALYNEQKKTILELNKKIAGLEMELSLLRAKSNG